VGNVVGSNLFNLLAVIGPTAVVQPLAVNDELLRAQVPALLLLTAALWVVLRTGHTVTRWEAGILLATYLAVITVSAM